MTTMLQNFIFLTIYLGKTHEKNIVIHLVKTLIVSPSPSKVLNIIFMLTAK